MHTQLCNIILVRRLVIQVAWGNADVYACTHVVYPYHRYVRSVCMIEVGGDVRTLASRLWPVEARGYFWLQATCLTPPLLHSFHLTCASPWASLTSIRTGSKLGQAQTPVPQFFCGSSPDTLLPSPYITTILSVFAEKPTEKCSENKMSVSCFLINIRPKPTDIFDQKRKTNTHLCCCVRYAFSCFLRIKPVFL